MAVRVKPLIRRSKFAWNDIRAPLPPSPMNVDAWFRTHNRGRGSKEEGCRWDWYLDARNRWISGSRTIQGVLQCSGTLKTSRDNGAEWATAAWHAALPRASLSVFFFLSLFLSSWRSTGRRETSSLLDEWSFRWKNFFEYMYIYFQWCIVESATFKVFEQSYRRRVFIYLSYFDRWYFVHSMLLGFQIYVK